MLSKGARSIRTGCGIPGCLLMLVFVAGCVSCWIEHVVVCLREGLWGFLIAGAIMFPIGIIHGFGLFLGWWH